MNELWRLIKGMGIQRKYIILLLLRSPFDALRTWMLAGLMKSVFLFLETGSGFADSLPKICVVYGLISTMLFVYNGVIWSMYAAFSAKAEALLQKKMFQKILGLTLKQADSRFSGEWITKLNSDIQAAVTMMNGPLNIPHLAVAVINTLLSIFLMLRSSLLFLGVSWIFILAQLYFNYKIVLAPLPKLKEAAQNAMSESTSSIKPLITDADAILLYDAGGLMMKKCDESSRKLMRINMKMNVRNALSDTGMHLFGIAGYLVILFTGYGFVCSGTMALSDVVYSFQVRGSMIAGVSMFITCLNHIKANSVCVKRIHDTLAEQEDVDEK